MRRKNYSKDSVKSRKIRKQRGAYKIALPDYGSEG
jgi:hypothetical protein